MNSNMKIITPNSVKHVLRCWVFLSNIFDICGVHEWRGVVLNAICGNFA